MKKTKTLPFISWLIIASLLISPLIVADFDGGAFGGFDSGGFDGGAFGGYDAGGFDGGAFGGYDAGGFDGGAFGGYDAGGFDGGANGGSDSGGFDGGANGGGADSGSGFDGGGSFDGMPGFGNPDNDFPPVPPGDNPDFPPEADAVWQNLEDVTILQASADGTLIQADVFSKCTDEDSDVLYFDITSASANYELFFIADDLRIFDLNPLFAGTETVTLTCNGVPESFQLHVIERGSPGPRPGPGGSETETSDDLSVHIGAIIIPNAYDALSGDTVPVTISFKNNGDDKLEDVSAAVAIQDLNIKASIRVEELPVSKRVSRTINVELPENVQPGTYYARITIDSGSLHRVKYRDVEVIA
jgi:hypothetical protein